MRKTLILSVALLLALVMTAQAGSVIVIANKGVGAASLSKADMQNIFLGRTVMWPDGKKINPVVLKSGGAHESFLNDMLGKNTSQFDTFWKQAIFSGKGRPPKSVAGEAEMVQFVSSNDGAVGYINADTAHSDVKVIDVK